MVVVRRRAVAVARRLPTPATTAVILQVRVRVLVRVRVRVCVRVRVRMDTRACYSLAATADCFFILLLFLLFY